MPTFEQKTCMTTIKADVCIKVAFSNGITDFMSLKSSGFSIYEGSLEGDRDVGVVMIDCPEDRKRLVITKPKTIV